MVPASFTSSNRTLDQQSSGYICGSVPITDKNNPNAEWYPNGIDFKGKLQQQQQQQQENSHQRQEFQPLLGSEKRMQVEDFDKKNSLASTVPFSGNLNPIDSQNQPFYISSEQTQYSRSYPNNQFQHRQTQSTATGECDYQLIAQGNQNEQFHEYPHRQIDLNTYSQQSLNVNDQNKIYSQKENHTQQQFNQGANYQANSNSLRTNVSFSQQEAANCCPQQYYSHPDITVIPCQNQLCHQGEDINDQYNHTHSLSFSQNYQTADTTEFYPREIQKSSSKTLFKTMLFNKDVSPSVRPYPSGQQQIPQQQSSGEDQQYQQQLQINNLSPMNYYYPQQQGGQLSQADQQKHSGLSIISGNYELLPKPQSRQQCHQQTEKYEDIPDAEQVSEEQGQGNEQGIQGGNEAYYSRENCLISKESQQQQNCTETMKLPSISKPEQQLQTLLHPKKTIKKPSNDSQQPLEQQSSPQQKRKYKKRKQKIEAATPERCGALAIRQQTPTIIPSKLIFQPFEKKKFSLFGDCVLDLGLLQVDAEDYKQRVAELFDDSKRVTHIQKVNNGDFLEITLDTCTKPLQDYQFLIEFVKSVSSQEAYKWYKVLSLFQAKCFKQTEFIKAMMRTSESNLDYLKNLFTLRRQSAAAKAQELIKELPRNKYAKYCSYHFDFETQSILLKHVGYSRKMLGIIGMNLQEAPSVFLRKGLLDMYLQKEKTFNLLLSAIQLVDHPKNQIIDQISGETFIHTLDLIKLQAHLSIRLVSLTYAFDKANNLNYPFCDDFFAEIIYEIDPENLQKFTEIREQKNVFGRFTTQEIVDGELEDLMEVNQFLAKYYATSVYQLQKSNCKNNFERRQLMENEENLGIEDADRQNSGQSSSEASLHSESSKSQQRPLDVCEIKTKDSSLSSNAMQISKANLIAFLDPTYVDFIQNP